MTKDGRDVSFRLTKIDATFGEKIMHAFRELFTIHIYFELKHSSVTYPTIVNGSDFY